MVKFTTYIVPLKSYTKIFRSLASHLASGPAPLARKEFDYIGTQMVSLSFLTGDILVVQVPEVYQTNCLVDPMSSYAGIAKLASFYIFVVKILKLTHGSS